MTEHPFHRSFERQYWEIYRPRYEEFLPRLRTLLEELVRNADIVIDHTSTRIKMFESICKKIDRKSYHNPFAQIKDFAGIRIVTCYQDDVENVANILYKEFRIDADHSGNRLTKLGVHEFGYRAEHVVISLSEPRISMKEWKRFGGLPVEVQIRSMLQHAWATISHHLIYKNEFQVAEESQRQISRLSALLELADDEFIVLRNHMKESTEGKKTEIAQDEVNIPLALKSLQQFMEQEEQSGFWTASDSFSPLRNEYPSMMSLKMLVLAIQFLRLLTGAEFESGVGDPEKLSVHLQQFVDCVNRIMTQMSAFGS